jgi:hypothetical protein
MAGSGGAAEYLERGRCPSSRADSGGRRGDRDYFGSLLGTGLGRDPAETPGTTAGSSGIRGDGRRNGVVAKKSKAAP